MPDASIAGRAVAIRHPAVSLAIQTPEASEVAIDGRELVAAVM
jgi:hypothetical protein